MLTNNPRGPRVVVAGERISVDDNTIVPRVRNINLPSPIDGNCLRSAKRICIGSTTTLITFARSQIRLAEGELRTARDAWK